MEKVVARVAADHALLNIMEEEEALILTEAIIELTANNVRAFTSTNTQFDVLQRLLRDSLNCQSN